MRPVPMRLGRPAALADRRQQPGGGVATFDRHRELRGDVAELLIGAGDRAQAPALADPVKLRDCLVKPLPQLRRTAPTAPRLQLMRRLGPAAGRWPLKPVRIRRLARGGALGRGGGKGGQAGAEARVWRAQARGRATPPATPPEPLGRLALNRPSLTQQSLGGICRSSGIPGPRQSDAPVVSLARPRTLPHRRANITTEPLHLRPRNQEPIPDTDASQPVAADPVADGLRGGAERLSCLGDGEKLGVGHGG